MINIELKSGIAEYLAESLSRTFSIGGNHFTHTARKNVRLTYVVMDNSVYGLTKNQTSPTSPIGFKSKTDIWGSKDRPINPIKQAISAGATFVARSFSGDKAQLVPILKAIQSRDPQMILALNADKEAPFGMVLKVLDNLKEAGVKGSLTAFMERVK